MKRRLKPAGFAILLLVVLIGYGIDKLRDGGLTLRPGSTVESTPQAESPGSVLTETWGRRHTGRMVQDTGTVQQVLTDDNEGSRHQRFIVRLRSGQTLLMAHNIDLAPRVPVRSGDVVHFKGQYEWNERGGVVHWTHHDPDGRRPAGWIDHAGQRYE